MPVNCNFQFGRTIFFSLVNRPSSDWLDYFCASHTFAFCYTFISFAFFSRSSRKSSLYLITMSFFLVVQCIPKHQTNSTMYHFFRESWTHTHSHWDTVKLTKSASQKFGHNKLKSCVFSTTHIACFNWTGRCCLFCLGMNGWIETNWINKVVLIHFWWLFRINREIHIAHFQY